MIKTQQIQTILNSITLPDLKSRLKIILKSKITKYMGFFLLSFFGFFLILSFCLSFVDIQKYIPQIEKQVLEKTGHEISINGPIKLNTFPKLGITIEEITLKEKPHSRFPILKAQTIKCYPHLLYLFLGKIGFKLEVKDLQYKSYFIPDFTTKIRFNNDILLLKSSKINFSRGKKEKWLYLDYIEVNYKNEIPVYLVKHNSSNFPISTLLELFNSNTKIVGNTKINLNLSAIGKSAHQIKKSLKGDIQLEIAKGNFHGLDLLTSLKEAKSLVETIASSLSHSVTDLVNTVIHRKEIPHGITPFDQIKIQLEVNNGIVTTKDLKIKHPHYFVDCIGHINLTKNSINYEIKALYKEHGRLTENNIAHSNLPHIKLFVTGALDKPQIKPDFSSYLHYVRNGGSEIKKPKVNKTLPSIKKWMKSITNKD